jgi:hypothetical protein
MTTYVHVHFDTISVSKSELYGPFGEPGTSAERRVFLGSAIPVMLCVKFVAEKA